MIIIIVSFIIKTEHSDKSISLEMSTKTKYRQERKNLIQSDHINWIWSSMYNRRRRENDFIRCLILKRIKKSLSMHQQVQQGQRDLFNLSISWDWYAWRIINILVFS